MNGEVRSFPALTSMIMSWEKTDITRVCATVKFSGKCPVSSQNDVGSGTCSATYCWWPWRNKIFVSVRKLSEATFKLTEVIRILIISQEIQRWDRLWSWSVLWFRFLQHVPAMPDSLPLPTCALGSFLKLVHLHTLWDSEEVRNHPHRCGLSVFLSDWTSLLTSRPVSWIGVSLGRRREEWTLGIPLTMFLTPPSLSFLFCEIGTMRSTYMIVNWHKIGKAVDTKLMVIMLVPVLFLPFSSYKKFCLPLTLPHYIRVNTL